MSAPTSRIRERKYVVVSPPKSASGQCLYTGEDTERLRLVRGLVDCGHAIGTVAGLNVESLRALVRPSGIVHVIKVESIPFLMVGPVLIAISNSVSDNIHVYGHPGSSEEAFRDARVGLRVDTLFAAVPSLTEDAILWIVAPAETTHAKAISVIFTSGIPRVIERASLGGLRVVPQSDVEVRPEPLIVKLVD